MSLISIPQLSELEREKSKHREECNRLRTQMESSAKKEKSILWNANQLSDFCAMLKKKLRQTEEENMHMKRELEETISQLQTKKQTFERMNLRVDRLLNDVSSSDQALRYPSKATEE